MTTIQTYRVGTKFDETVEMKAPGPGLAAIWFHDLNPNGTEPIFVEAGGFATPGFETFCFERRDIEGQRKYEVSELEKALSRTRNDGR